MPLQWPWREPGFDVAINYASSEKAAHETAELAKAKGAKTLLFQCDVSDDPTVRKMLAAVEQEFGRLDALVNNAGTTTEIGPKDFEALTTEIWDRVFAVNVRGVFQVTRAAAPMLKKAREHRQYGQHRRLAARPAAAALRRQQSRGGESYQTFGAQSGARNPRECGRARLDGRRLDGAHVEGQVSDLMARRAKFTPLAAGGDRRGCSRSDSRIDHRQQVRHRRSHRDRRRLRRVNVRETRKMLRGSSSFSAGVRASLSRARLLGGQVTRARNSRPVFERYADRVAIIDRDRSFTYADIDRLTDNLALNLLRLGFKPLDRVVVQLAQCCRIRDFVFCAAKDRGDSDRSAHDASLCGNQPVCRAIGSSGLRDSGPAGRL